MALQLYTFVMDCLGGTYISQHFGADHMEAIMAWAQNPHPEMLVGTGYNNLRNVWSEEVMAEMQDWGPAPLDGLESVWCCGFPVQGKSFLLNVIKTASSLQSDGA